MNRFSKFFMTACSPFDRLFYTSQLAVLLLGLLFCIINSIFTHYKGVPYAEWKFSIVVPILLGLSALSLLIKDNSPGIHRVVHSYSQYWVFLIVNTVFLQGIQYTPFATIDHQLAKLDQLLLFNTVSVMQWVHERNLVGFLSFFYELLRYELFFLPGIALFFISRNRFKKFLMAFVIATLISEIIYYFFPTQAPASVYHSDLFPLMAQETHNKFYQVHHALSYQYPPGTGGLIAFPSLHVISGIMYAYLCIDRPWLFGIVGTANTILIFSTVLLGWHFLMDAIASIIISIICIEISRRWVTRLENCE